MNNFLKKITSIFICVFILAFITDKFFDYFYMNFSNRKVFNSIKKDYDMLVLGDSRVKHNIIPSLLDSSLGISSINLGIAGSNPLEALTMLKLYLHHFRKPKIIAVEVYNKIHFISSDVLSRQQFLQYYNSDIISSYFNYSEDVKFYQIPLYRYTKYRDLGWREFYKTLLKNYNSSISNNKGYSPLDYKEFKENIIELNNNEKLDLNNLHIDSLISLCNDEGIKLIFFTSPIYSNKNSELLNQLEAYLPNYLNQIDILKEKKYFKDNIHVNHEGAKVQTNHLSKYIKTILN